MSTTPMTGKRTFRQRWMDFWFSPADPTMLGFIRIVAGLLVLYLHFSYTMDLDRFFGRVGFWGQDYINRERKEYPWPLESFFAWDERADGVSESAMARVPEYPHRKKAVMDFIRNLPTERAQREASLRFYTRLVDTQSQDNARLGLQWLMQLPEITESREEKLRAMVENPAPNPEAAITGVLPVPEFIAVLPKTQRETVADEIRAFLNVLPPPGTIGDSPRGYVLNHLRDMDLDHIKAFHEFIINLPADANERRDLIDYLEYWNVDRRRVSRTGHDIFSVWFHISDPKTMMAMHVGILVVMGLFTAGAFTRVTSVLTWLAALCYIHRSQQVLFGMDTMMSILLFYLMIGKSGAALSVDRWWQKRRAIRASIARCGTIDDRTRAFLAAPPPSVLAGFGLRCIQVHFCFIYMASGLSKLKGAAWWNGTAIWDVMVNPEFTLLRYSWYEWGIRQLAELKPVYYTFITLGAWFTLFLEIAFPFLVWTRWRPFMVWCALLLHAGIGILMGLNLFELMMMAMLLSYIPGWVVREWLGKNGEAPPPTAKDSASLRVTPGRIKTV